MATLEELEQRIEELEQRISNCEEIMLAMDKYIQNSMQIEVRDMISKEKKALIDILEILEEVVPEATAKMQELANAKERMSKKILPDFPWDIKKEDPEQS